MVEELKPAKHPDMKKVSVASFVKMKSENRRIVMVTSYDYPTASIANAAGVDSILVGDSYGMVVLGYENTIPVTVEELLPVCRAVRRGAPHPLLIGDLPFMSFQVSQEEAIRTAGRFVKEGGMEAVKIEGGSEVSEIVKSISRIGIPVLGHMGVTPQTATLHGGYRIQGRCVDSSDKLIADAKSLEEAGVFGIVLEMVTEEVAKVITDNASVPTIGIGSGRFCDGQVLVLHDLIGLYPSFTPKFAKRYVDVAGTIKQALQSFTAEVRNGVFPDEQHTFRMDEDQRAKLESKLKT